MSETLYTIYWRNGTKGTSGNGTTGLPYTEAKEAIDNLNQEDPDVHHWLQISPTDTRQCYYLGCLSHLDSISPPLLFQCSACDRLVCQNDSTDHMIHCEKRVWVPVMTMVRNWAHVENPDRIV